MLETHNVGVPVKFTQEDDLTEGPLCIGWILEGIEYFFNCNNIFSFLVICLPYDTIGSLS
jgi:hypothetical protein